ARGLPEIRGGEARPGLRSAALRPDQPELARAWADRPMKPRVAREKAERKRENSPRKIRALDHSPRLPQVAAVVRGEDVKARGDFHPHHLEKRVLEDRAIGVDLGRLARHRLQLRVRAEVAAQNLL